MNFRVLGSVTGAVMLMAWTAPGPAIGQTTAPPRWNPPRLVDGQPDMQGHWISDAVGAAHSVEDGRDPADDVIQSRIGERNPIVIVDPPDRRIPYQQAAAARRTQLLRDIFTPTQAEHVDPHVRALLDGVPRNNYVPGGMQFIQRPGYVLILYESNHAYRVIPAGRAPARWRGGEAVDGGLTWTLGRQYAGCRCHELQRRNVDRFSWKLPQRCVARGGTLDAGRP